MMMETGGRVMNRIGYVISFVLLCAVLVASPALADEVDGNTTLSAIAGKMTVETGTGSIDAEPARPADEAASRAAGVLQQYEPRTTGRITSLSTLDNASATTTGSPQLARNAEQARGYSAWRKSSKSEVTTTKNALPQHAPPKRSSDSASKADAKPSVEAAPAKAAAPAKSSKVTAPAAGNAAPVTKPTAKSTKPAPSATTSALKAGPAAAPSTIAVTAPAKTVQTAVVKPDTAAKKQVVAAPAAEPSSSKISSANTSSASNTATNSRSWRSRIFGSTGKAAVTDTTSEPQVVAAKSTTSAPVASKTPVAPVATKVPAPVQTAASTAAKPAPKAVSATTSTAPAAAAPVVVASDRKGATKGSGKALQPTVTENPSAGGSLIARGDKSGTAPNIMRVLTGKSIMVDLAKDSKRVAVADPKIAEVLIITPKQIMVNGLADGETSIIIWDRAGNYTMSSVVVGDDLADQVMLEVTVAEINRSAMERHGVDYRNFGGQFNSITQYGGAAPTGGSYPPSQSDPPFPVSLDGGISWAIIDTKNDIALLFKQLQDDNLGRILAEPKLLSRSGKEAHFLSGGEIPIVITTNDDTSIEFKEFGTKVDFTPAVREDGTIDLAFQAEVSEPDFSAGIELFGFSVPAFITRRSNTEVSLRDSQSLIVAGLIKETKQELESKMPFVGDIPVLGYFFRRTEYTNDILELIMVVKPRLVRPIPAGTRVALPTDRGPLTRQEVRTGPVEEKVSRPRPY